ncbi:uncharacterized protein LOC129730180 [Wyeomyia smithii]|uniref:uncharacterized protein LOC129730180 n=1 Tax=Wyeomyia smithii TaxID=174621 RepID=UPI0024681A90|nr:uncharacterized protein LOC129730180 [Wyeomyia smithii]
MSREVGHHHKKAESKQINPQTQYQRRVVISKSPYKIYDLPTRSHFSICLDNIKRENQSTTHNKQHEVKKSTEIQHQPGPSGKTALIRDDSSTRLTRMRVLNFRDAYSEYMRRQSITPRRIRIVKIYAPLKWEEVLEESIKKFVPIYKLNNSWQQSRLHWLEQLEQENEKLPYKSQSDEVVSSTPCCYFFLCPIWTQKRKL